MTNKPSRYTITSALPYANGPVHIGHLAGVYVPADIYARFLRSKGENVLFIGGSDEHGVPITIRAKKEGVTPQQVVDKYHVQIKQSFEELGISFDIYSRTSSKIHAETSSEYFKKLYEDGKFIEQTSEQYYDPKAEQFLADRYIIGTCPKCGNENAYGDQCEKCGSTLSPSELINPRSTLSGEKPVMKSTKHWFLPLDQYEPWLKQWILEDHKNWKTNVYGQCKSWLDQGLQPRAVTRDLDWGVPVPVAGAEGKVLYVWFDAPIGYISAAKDYFKNSEIKAVHKNNTWEDFWKKDDTKLVHFIGKDNIVFHCIIFPAMLKAEGSYILPDNVPANEFMNLEGDKISTSRNWAVWLHEYLEEFKGKQDVLRYALCANAPETKDNDFTWRDFQARNNNELVAIYGNFVNRALVLTHKYYDSVIPALGKLEASDEGVIMMLKEFPAKIAASIEQYRFREALGFMMDLARLGNKYLADTEPWKIYKENPERVKTILHIGLQIAANLAIVSEPFIPFTSAKLFTMLNLKANTWNNAGTIDLLKAGDQLGTAELLFDKIEDATIEAQVKKLEDTKQANLLANAEVKPLKENVSFDDFAKMDIRVATIIAAEKVAKTKKLLKLTLKTGIDERTVVSGIAEHFEPEAIIGQQVSLLANLAPREIKGIVSQGMILMAEDADGSLKFVQPAAVVNAGSMIG
ncbi:methionine--tRNA ligase [Cytophaga hutchinsonii]|uniref:Methionine--tRNA ligase n=1 Tax=Cytophaga hutchinsonii (strain ATCC 33406 / DSM 1761 / CIP 103989 / NBRC 15051 / NCIMB 9469 / D465) TaxID=269798 RepID=SYM_CYTH3|nr:methionine--tRNA ligase [Cytophaga hutchinsonii]Q11RM3.1 RecName: Full=Methionine--tRNA ligase; AltName: Full=Methionyl-tRNA synthetase; Short=MetRS [Cytophaga hutchinsonii ATCC 33406]ABG59941.1 methionyl-tRNA synthetase [Cytophaga hutchinsonii ATCC 33406]SFX27010.1 methionyl-tRNA synthetase [Cytophaga hutchinsonii ATCC 33406]